MQSMEMRIKIVNEINIHLRNLFSNFSILLSLVEGLNMHHSRKLLVTM